MKLSRNHGTHTPAAEREILDLMLDLTPGINPHILREIHTLADRESQI